MTSSPPPTPGQRGGKTRVCRVGDPPEPQAEGPGKREEMLFKKANLEQRTLQSRVWRGAQPSSRNEAEGSFKTKLCSTGRPLTCGTLVLGGQELLHSTWVGKKPRTRSKSNKKRMHGITETSNYIRRPGF